ncbi:MAG: hypothetical protein ACOC53_08510 [Candidatus Saliniplasma sp.]
MIYSNLDELIEKVEEGEPILVNSPSGPGFVDDIRITRSGRTRFDIRLWRGRRKTYDESEVEVVG